MKNVNGQSSKGNYGAQKDCFGISKIIMWIMIKKIRKSYSRNTSLPLPELLTVLIFFILFFFVWATISQVTSKSRRVATKRP